ncbi:MAG: hypothetical protein GX967_02300 [Clostridiales bacterium]|nr:hypothetical protein [Clostridiales bacterium]
MDVFLARTEKLERDTELLFSKVNAFAISQACVDEKLSNIMTTLNELKSSVSELNRLPIKRWETFIGAVISALVAMVMGFLFGRGI